MGNASNNKNKIKEFVQKVEEKTNNALDDSLMDEDAKAENFDVNYTDIVKNSAKARISKLAMAYFYIFDFNNCDYVMFYVF